MFKEIFSFELRSHLRKPMVYIFTLINFALLYSATVSDKIVVGVSNDAVNINAPSVIMSTVLLMTLLGIFMTTAFMNVIILKDYKNRFDGILFSTPITKFGFLGGRFLAAFILSLTPMIGVFAGIYLGSTSAMVNPSKVGVFDLSAYVSAFLIGVLPNTILIASIAFLFTSLFKSQLYSFIGAMGVLVLYVIMGSFAHNLDNQGLAIICDPIAFSSYSIISKYWTIAEQNTTVISFTGPLFINRVIWLGVSVFFIVLTFVKFSFSAKAVKNTKDSTLEKANEKQVFQKLSPLKNISITDDIWSQINQCWFQTKIEITGIIKSAPFIILLLFGLINMQGSIFGTDNWFGTGNHPTTYLMVEAIRNSLYLFLVVIIMYYSGSIIWRERENKMNEFFDASPIPSWIPFLSKFFSVIGITLFILSFAILVGILVQAIKGYFNFELSIYIIEFLLLDIFRFVVLITLSMFVQTIINNKHLGFFVFLLMLIGFSFGPAAAGIQSNLVIFGNTPSYIYSDMNKWSLFSSSLAWFHIYWLLFASVLSALCFLFWERGISLNWRQRFSLAARRLQGNFLYTLLILATLWIGTGSFIFYQTKVINTISTEVEEEKHSIDYEKGYKRYQHIAQPRIVKLNHNVNIYPTERMFDTEADVIAVNKTKESISEVHFSITKDATKTTIEIANSELVLEDSILNYNIYKLNTPLVTGDSLRYKVITSFVSGGIENEVTNRDVVKNGTFIDKFRFMPIIGYNSRLEVTDKKTREEHGLSPHDGLAKVHSNCSHACQNTYINSDSDWVNVSCTLSTSADQLAIAPGTLVKEWGEKNRRFFRYELKKPVIDFYSFISGRYEVARDVWPSPTGEEVDVEVYYHKGHEYNIDKMISAVTSALTFHAENFSPYPHEQARIIEFPRYRSFAQAFPGTMPYSENMGFIANLNKESSIDMVRYIVAHEISHQWWAHQVISAKTQGATMLSESFAQYCALMIMKKEYGKDKMKQFLRYEMNSYLKGRSLEENKEQALLVNEGQEYIHYKKGSVVMYALQEYIGEDNVNKAMKEFMDAVAYQEPPYTNSLQFMDYLYIHTPDSLEYILIDMFENITLYNNKTTKATYTPLENGKYEVKIDINIEKIRADSLGNETVIAHDDFIDIGVYSDYIKKGHKYGTPILEERHRINTQDTSFTFVVDEKPYKVGVDPNYLLIDRFPEDNLKKLTLH